jgi:hypothetical protein
MPWQNGKRTLVNSHKGDPVNVPHSWIRSSIFVAAAMLWAVPAAAASALAAIPVSLSVTYHITTQTSKPPAEGGQQSTDTYLRITRVSATAFNVQVNGAPAGQIVLNSNGTLNVPPTLNKVFTPFGEAAMLMRGAPRPLAPNSSWAANVPVPLSGSTDHVAATVSVTQASPTGATVVANGQNSTTVKPLIRQHPADVNFNAAMTYNNAGMLTYANSNVSVSIRAGAFRTKHVSSSWTLSLAGQ